MIKMWPVLTKLAIFAVLAVLATTLIYSTLRNTVSGATNTYRASFIDVTGLHEGDDVRIAGVKVGRIEDIDLVDNHAEVGFSVRADQPIFENTRALIRYQNLIGQRYLALVPGQGKAKPLADGARIPQERTEPSFDLSALLNGFEPLFELLEPADVNRLSETIVQVFQGSGPAMNTLLVQAAELTSTFADRDEIIGAVLDNLTSVLGHLAGKGEEFGALIGQTEKLVDGLTANAGPIVDAMESIHAVSGNVSGLIGDIRPSLRADLVKFNDVAGLFLSEGPVVEATLTELPTFLNSLSRITSYGSWMNLYVCQLDINLAPFPRGVIPRLTGGDLHTEVCR